jgi:uncharacterized membrane protein YraQ (UPF0718 family)
VNEILLRGADAAWGTLYDAGFYVIFGLLAAGLIHLFISRDWLVRHLGGRGFGSVLKAALLGAPMPLCSCSVLPAACALRSKGAGRGATVSFLISTPETGVDSIALTWALMGPIMAIVRPVAAIATAMAAGFIETLRDRHEPPAKVARPLCTICNSNDCEHIARPTRWSRFWTFVLYDMGDDLGPSLALGLVAAGIMGILIPDNFFEQYLGSPWTAMLVMLAVGLPMYVCATASTPMAAVLVAKGLNPGAALVFLLAGPATNFATMLVVSRMLGKASAAIYVGTIAAMSLACGAVFDLIVGALNVNVISGEAHELVPPWLLTAGAVVLMVFLVFSLSRWAWRHSPWRPAMAACCSSAGCAEHAAAEAKSGCCEADAAHDACCAGDHDHDHAQ